MDFLNYITTKHLYNKQKGVPLNPEPDPDCHFINPGKKDLDKS